MIHVKGVDDMPMYVGLYKLTEKGAADIRNSPERFRKAIEGWEALGGTVTAALATIGQYDFVSIGEAPSDEVAALHAAGMASTGTVTTQTLRAFTPEEFAALVAKMR
jgi:uncharacterized protein with GYD domain